MKLSFQEKLSKRIFYIGFFIVLTIVIVIYFSGAYYDHLNLNKKIQNNQNIIKNEFKAIFLKLDDSFKRFETDEHLKTFFTNQNDPYPLYQELSSLNHNDFKHQIVLFNHNKEIIFSSFKEEFNSIDLSYQKFFIIESDQNIYTNSYYRSVDNISNYYIIYTKKTNNNYIMYYLKDNDLLAKLQNRILDNFLITDEKDNIIISSNKFLNRQNFNASKLKINDTTYLINKTSIDKNLNLITFTKESNLFNIESLALVAITSLVLSFLLIKYYSKKISIKTTTSLKLLISQLKQIKNGELKLSSLKTDDEFEIISNNINEMLEEIQNLAHNNQQLLILGQQMELKQLQAQFNPHFLYNTLETIRCLIFIDKDSANTLILKLTKILRYSINQNTQQVLFVDDFNYIQNFLDIIKIRFEKRFNYVVKIDERCNNIKIPKLIIQPLIENSIKHNFKTKNELTIWISADIIDNDLIIEVEDNGEGMKKDELEKLRANLHLDTNHIGLANVYKRLKLLYQENSELTINSYQNIGTKISIRIRTNNV